MPDRVSAPPEAPPASAGAVCSECGSGPASGGTSARGPLCRACAYRDAVGGSVARRTEVLTAVADARSARDPARLARWRTGAAWFAIAGSAILAWFVVPELAGAMSAPSPFAYGDTDPETGPALRECLTGLWAVRAAADEYAASHRGAAPTALADLAGAPAACPGCGGAWVFDRSGRDWSVACPNPRAHQRGSVVLKSAWGPPVVTSAAEGGAR